MTLQRKSRLGETKIRQLKPGDPIPDGVPRRYKSDPRGYVRLRWKVGKGEYVETYEHRLAVGLPEGDVHHENEVKDENTQENLRVMSKADHAREHAQGRIASSNRVLLWDGARSQIAFDKREGAKRRRAERATQVERIGILYQEGKSTTEIGHLLNLHSSTVSRAVRVAGVVPRAVARRNTDISLSVRQSVHARARMRCERCGKNLTWGGGQVHHRRPRHMGGSRDPVTNALPNLMFICGDCHDWIEHNRAQAYKKGWLVHSWEDPAEIPWGPA
jgi:5-methylcytosine-specific restriction protein A